MEKEVLKKVLSYLNLKKLPKEGDPSPTGRSIAKVHKDNGRIGYAITRFDKEKKKNYVIKDFSVGNVKEFLEFYPIREKANKEEDSTIKFYSLPAAQMKAWLDERNIPYEKEKKTSYVKAYNLSRKKVK